VAAANAAGRSGEVIGYEANPEFADTLRKTATLNNVDITVRNAAVGGIDTVWGGDTAEDIPVVETEKLPDSDVLELDCEGQEWDILHELTNWPERLIIEIHPTEFNADPRELISYVQNQGYELEHRICHGGSDLTPSQFDTMLDDIEVPDRCLPPIAVFSRV
jgi:hypothetical protein